MILKCVSPQLFYDCFPAPETVYGSISFNRLNEYKAEPAPATAPVDPHSRLAWVVAETDALRIGLALGFRNGAWHAPFSAPFTEILTDGDLTPHAASEFASSLRDFLQAPVEITLPSEIYSPAKIPILVEGFTQAASLRIDDCNFHYPTTFADNFRAHLCNSAKNKYNQACRNNFRFEKTDDLARTYAVIKANRESHGYRLAMTLPQVAETVDNAVRADYFILSLDDIDIASAIVYHVAPRIVQVIYWGDIPGYSAMRPMNLLPIRIMQHYAASGIDIVDVGPASTDGIRNEGLASFKLSLGCLETPRFTFYKT